MRGLVDAEGFCLSDGVRIWYRVEGAAMPATPLLLVHGGPGATARPFERTIGPLLARSRPVVYLDYRGAGRSDRPADPAAYSFERLARDIEALRRHLGIERWAVFGHSLGAATAITHAAAQPDTAAALLLCAPLIDGAANVRASVAQKVARAPAALQADARRLYQTADSPEAAVDALVRLIGQRTRHEFQFYEPATSRVLDEIQDGLARELGRPLMDAALWQGLNQSGLWRFDGFALLPRLPMPQAVLLSPFDPEISIDAAVCYVASAQDATLISFRHSGHHPYLEETPLCVRSIATFLAERRL